MADKKYLDYAGLVSYTGYIKGLITKVTASGETTQQDVDAIKQTLKQLEATIGTNTLALETLNSDKGVQGSVEHSVAQAIAEVVNGAPQEFDTLKEIADWITADPTRAAEIQTKISTVQNKVTELEDKIGTPNAIDAEAQKTVYKYFEDKIEDEITNRGAEVADLKSKLSQEIDDVESTADDNKKAIAKLNDSAEVEGSVENKIKSAIDGLDKFVAITDDEIKALFAEGAAG